MQTKQAGNQRLNNNSGDTSLNEGHKQMPISLPLSLQPGTSWRWSVAFLPGSRVSPTPGHPLRRGCSGWGHSPCHLATRSSETIFGACSKVINRRKHLKRGFSVAIAKTYYFAKSSACCKLFTTNGKLKFLLDKFS